MQVNWDVKFSSVASVPSKRPLNISAADLSAELVGFETAEEHFEKARLTQQLERMRPALLNQCAAPGAQKSLSCKVQTRSSLRLGLDFALGVALVHLDTSTDDRSTATALSNAASCLLDVDESLLRVIVIHVAPDSPIIRVRASTRTLERARHALKSLRERHVPIICSGPSRAHGVAAEIARGADCMISAGHAVDAQRRGRVSFIACSAADAQHQAQQFAAWLSSHPPIGLRHVLSLVQSASPRRKATSTFGGVLNLCGTAQELSLELHRHLAVAELAEHRISTARPLSAAAAS